MAKDKADETSKAAGTAPTGAPADASAARPKLRYQDILDLPETFADSIGQWIFDGQMMRIEFTVTRLDPSPAGQAPSSGRLLPAARLVLTPACAIQLARQSQQLIAALEKAAAAVQQAGGAKPPPPPGR
jgi:hypothetical protein